MHNSFVSIIGKCRVRIPVRDCAPVRVLCGRANCARTVRFARVMVSLNVAA